MENLEKQEQCAKPLAGVEFSLDNFKWTREPASFKVEPGKVEVTTNPHTDLWQRTYYHFRNDNAPVFQMSTDQKYFSFVVKADFAQANHRFDQSGIVLYLDSENWIKASIEYENESFAHLGSVVTNNGYSDWATTQVSTQVKSMYFRLSRRESDYCVECSDNGVDFKLMRICHLYKGDGVINFGIYACSPEESSFTTEFTDFALTDCQWKTHDGQQPDPDLI